MCARDRVQVLCDCVRRRLPVALCVTECGICVWERAVSRMIRTGGEGWEAGTCGQAPHGMNNQTTVSGLLGQLSQRGRPRLAPAAHPTSARPQARSHVCWAAHPEGTCSLSSLYSLPSRFLSPHFRGGSSPYPRHHTQLPSPPKGRHGHLPCLCPWLLVQARYHEIRGTVKMQAAENRQEQVV